MDFFKKLIDNAKTILSQKYFCFEGRAGQGEFWMWVLAVMIAHFISGLIPKAGPILGLVITLGTLLPYLGVTARRLHDRGKSGWLQLLAFIPIVGVIIVLILCIPEGDKEANKYGEPVK
ncbi:MAG: DUF805 domain-containing protein [Kiritimatiellae bacterium]|nr:DUF805 domain-containing protein [Kiritimatiellia bacterium]